MASLNQEDAFRIVQVVQEFSRAGGVETVAVELQRQWIRTGVRSQVLAASVGPDIGLDEAGHVRLALPKTVADRIPTRGTWRYLGRSAIVPSFTMAATASLRRGRKPGGWAAGSVILSHGDSLLADAIVLHAINAASLAQKRQDRSWRWALNPMHLWVGGRDRLMLGGLRARRYVAVSERVADELQRHHRVPRDRIVVIPNGTDIAKFTPNGPGAGLRARFSIPDASPLLLFAGHEFGRKGLSLVIGALTRPGLESARLVVAGAGDIAAFTSLAEASGVSGRVHFVGPWRDMAALYRDADAFVFPSAYETFSLVCMEALACGVPVLATRAGGIEDYLVDGLNGRFVERNADAIATTLVSLLSDRDGLERMRRCARETALRFGWEDVAARYEALLREIWSEKQSGRSDADR